MTRKTRSTRLSESIDRLSAMIENGELLAATNPAGLLDAVADELVKRRADPVVERDETEPPPGIVVDQCPSDTTWPCGWRAVLAATGEQVRYARTRDQVIAEAWDERREVIEAWHLEVD